MLGSVNSFWDRSSKSQLLILFIVIIIIIIVIICRFILRLLQNEHIENCCNIATREVSELAWINVVRYLGIYVESSSISSSFKCSLDSAKCSIYRSFNAVFGKIGRIASHEVILKLLKSKCFPALYYGLEACPLRKSQHNSINYVINSKFCKIFDMRSQEVVDICLYMFNCLFVEKAIDIDDVLAFSGYC